MNNNRTPASNINSNTGRSAKRLADAARRIGASKRVTPHSLLSADSATRSLRAAAAHPLVRDISDERGMEDGVWIYLHDGWNCPAADANAIHEDTIAAALACLKGAYYDAATLDEPEADALAAEAAEAAEAAAPADTATPEARLAAAQAAFDALAAARTASAIAAGIDPECDPRPQSPAMKRAAVELGLARAARLAAPEAPKPEAAAPAAGTGSAAQDAVNRAWNDAAAAEAVAHAEAAARDRAAAEVNAAAEAVRVARENAAAYDSTPQARAVSGAEINAALERLDAARAAAEAHRNRNA